MNRNNIFLCVGVLCASAQAVDSKREISLEEILQHWHKVDSYHAFPDAQGGPNSSDDCDPGVSEDPYYVGYREKKQTGKRKYLTGNAPNKRSAQKTQENFYQVTHRENIPWLKDKHFNKGNTY